jgi:hypothetical protein
MEMDLPRIFRPDFSTGIGGPMVDKRIVSAGCVLLVGAAAWLLSGSATTAKTAKQDDHSQSRIRKGLEIAPVPLDLAARTARPSGWAAIS